MDISVIVPIYNGEKTAEKFLEQLVAFQNESLKKVELIIVNDGSVDSTPQIVGKFSKDATIFTHEKNRGKGCAIKTGFLNAKGKILVFIDGDGAYPPEEISKVLEGIKGYDVSLGMKRLKASIRITPEPLYRSVLGKSFNFIVNMLFSLNICDTLCGIKAYRADIGKALVTDLKSYDWLFDVEMLFKTIKKGYSINQIPVKLYHVGDSKFRIYDPLLLFFKLFKLRIKLKGYKA